MKIRYIPKSDYVKYESSIDRKICLDICDKTTYGDTDSNFFYKLHYLNLDDKYNQTSKKFGMNIYKEIFSYQILCQMICVELPKTYYNIKPFKLNHFKTCCIKCKKYMIDCDIHIIYTPVFATEILEGNWKDIINVMSDVFTNDIINIFK